MKGISTILAMILIVIIVVALIGLTYTFAIGLFQTTTEGATDTTTEITNRMQKTAIIVSARCSEATNNVIFTIRSTGSGSIQNSEIAAFVDDTLLTNLANLPNPLDAGDLSGEITGSGGVTFTDGQEYRLKVSVPAGETPIYRVTCTA